MDHLSFVKFALYALALDQGEHDDRFLVIIRALFPPLLNRLFS